MVSSPICISSLVPLKIRMENDLLFIFGISESASSMESVHSVDEDIVEGHSNVVGPVEKAGSGDGGEEQVADFLSEVD